MNYIVDTFNLQPSQKVFYVDVGNLSPEKCKELLEEILAHWKKEPEFGKYSVCENGLMVREK